MTIAIEILAVAAVLFGLLCGAVGYWWAASSQKRIAGGKSVKQLAEEKQAYQDQVEDHFKTTAELLNEMTDKYRDVYRHMAEGAQRLAPSESAGPALAALRNGLLAAPGADTANAEAIIDSEASGVIEDQANAELDVESAVNSGAKLQDNSNQAEEGLAVDEENSPQQEGSGATETENSTDLDGGEKAEFFSNRETQTNAADGETEDSEHSEGNPPDNTKSET